MKKMLLFALAGIMTLAFTQCGGSTGTKEFQDNKELVDNLRTTVEQATTCDELQGAVWGVAMAALANADTEYSDEEKMTEAETKTLEELADDVQDLIKKKGEELGCSAGNIFSTEEGSVMLQNDDEYLDDVEEELVEENQ